MSRGAYRRIRRAIGEVMSLSRAMTAFASRRYRISGTPCRAQAAPSLPAARARPTRNRHRAHPQGRRATPTSRVMVRARWPGHAAGSGLPGHRHGRRAAISPPVIAPTRRPSLFPLTPFQMRYTKRIYHSSRRSATTPRPHAAASASQSAADSRRAGLAKMRVTRIQLRSRGPTLRSPRFAPYGRCALEIVRIKRTAMRGGRRSVIGPCLAPDSRVQMTVGRVYKMVGLGRRVPLQQGDRQAA